MNKFRTGILFFTILLIAGWDASLSAQEGTIVFDQEILWQWPTAENEYGGYGFYWWHRKESVVNINYGNMPSTDWTRPENYYDGEFVMRFEVLDQPTSEDFYVQFGIWQDKDKGPEHPETVASRQYIEGGDGAVFEGSLGSPTIWWNKQGEDPVDFSRPGDFYRIGIVLWNADPICIPKGDDWGGGCPELAENFFPMRAKVTVKAYPSGTPLDNYGNDEVNMINIQPNPASDEIILESSKIFIENTSFAIYDIRGKLVDSGIIPKNTLRKSLDISNIPDGVYFIKIQSRDDIYFRKLVVNK